MSPQKSATSFRTTWILLGGAAVLLGGLTLYVFLGDDKKPNTEGFLFETYRGLGTKPNDITGFEIDKEGKKIVFSRQSDGRWKITQPIQARADTERVEQIVGELLQVRRDDKSADLTSDLGAQGLDNPAVKLTLRKGEREATLSLGKTTIGGDQAVVYVMSSDNPNTPHAVKKGRFGSLFVSKPPENASTAEMVLGLNDFRIRKLLGEGIPPEGAATQLKSIKLTENLAKGTRVVKLSNQNEARVWRFEIPLGYGDVETNVTPEKSNPKSIYNLSSLLINALTIEVPEIKDYLTEARDLKTLGLDPTSPGVLRIDIERQDNVKTETLWIGPEVKTEGDKVYVRYEGDSSVAQVNGEKARMIRNFLADPTPLRDSTLLKLRRDRIDALDITQDGKTIELRKVGSKWQVKGDDKINDANEKNIEDLLYGLNAQRNGKGFPLAGATDDSLGLTPPSVEIKVWVDGIIPTAKGADPKGWPKVNERPAAKILFGKKDLGEVVFVRREIDGVKNDFKMPESLLEIAKRGRLDYINLALGTFDINKVEKISFTKDGETWEIAREKPGLNSMTVEWTILAPASKKGRPASVSTIAECLNAYQQLRPTKVIAEKPSADQLNTLGLDAAKPLFKFAIKIEGEPNERTYYFGNPVTSKPDVYARASVSDYVFEAPVALREMVEKARFTDPTLYRIEPGDVKGMKLTGWAMPPSGEPTVLDLERKSGGIWSAKGKQEFDELLVESFFKIMARPQTIELVTEKADPKVELGFEVKQGALEVEIDVGKDKPVTLTLGATVPKDSRKIYVRSNQAPGEIYTMNSEQLLPVKEKMSALQLPMKK